MIVALLGILIGILIGSMIPLDISSSYSIYLAVGILAAIDSVLGGIRANLRDEFDTLIFISGFVTNMILAALLTYIGDKMGIPLYYATVFVFGTRLFQNLSIIRHIFVERLRHHDDIEN